MPGPWELTLVFETERDRRDWVNLYLDGGIEQQFKLHDGEYLYAGDWHRTGGANKCIVMIEIWRGAEE